eukprot:gnl/TRDRNA2_/TRDRNA2_194819_c0_seq1.p1 gnl/TRDRNA2_/TRDRNA2_194819_c0~~gnl/TRDRNA2_/TRDRNA2_194819_c0_seq1.p1  ORF type:complete len:202 (+),score=48.91 gnl/TRDRNA2_/TRDRNA2_194819_c0_seq1:134-739(+)
MEGGELGSRKVLGLTYVLYEKGNIVSQALAIASLTPLFAGFGLISAFVVTRRVFWAWAFITAALVDIFCQLLKEGIGQPRPEGSYRPGAGMPSEHAAFSTFLAVHLSLRIASGLRCALLLKAFAWLALFSWAGVVAVSRHHLGVHTAAQLMAGALIGAVLGAASAALEVRLRKPLARLQRLIDAIWSWLDIQAVDVEDHKD